MLINTYVDNDPNYTFTVARIKLLQALMSSVDKRIVNKFIDEIRAQVLTYHRFQSELSDNQAKQNIESFFHQLNNRAHQLSRFTLELSRLVNQAPADLFEQAKKADRAIDSIHGNLVNLCLTIDEMTIQKKDYLVDATATVQKIYDSFARTFDVTPTGKSFADQISIQPGKPIEDLLVPVVEILICKDHVRCHSLVKKVIDNKGNARL